MKQNFAWYIVSEIMSVPGAFVNVEFWSHWAKTLLWAKCLCPSKFVWGSYKPQCDGLWDVANVMEVGLWEIIGFKLGEGRTLMLELVPEKKKKIDLALHVHARKKGHVSARQEDCHAGRGPSPRAKSAGTLIFHFPNSRTVRNSCPQLKPPAYGILLQQLFKIVFAHCGRAALASSVPQDIDSQ